MTKARDIASAAPAPSTVSATEIGYLDGVSSAIQTQIDGKSGTSHNHDSTYVAKSLVDAKGDLLVGSANDTVSRLAVASTAGYVLTVDSAEATGLKWASASSTPTFVGCSVYATTHQTISTATFTDLTWNSEIFDTDGFHSTTTNTARMTIPAGKGGYYRVTCRAQWNAASATGQRNVSIFKNGTRWNNGNQPGDTVAGPAVTTSQIMNLVAGDYITMAVYQNSGGNMDIYRIDDPGTGGYQSQFEIEYLGA